MDKKETWLELFIMLRYGKDQFMFGQLNMNISVFSYVNETEVFMDASNVKFSSVANIDNIDDLNKFLESFEVDLSGFITLYEYESLEGFQFTKEAYETIQKSIQKPGQFWINKEWSDTIEGL